MNPFHIATYTMILLMMSISSLGCRTSPTPQDTSPPVTPAKPEAPAVTASSLAIADAVWSVRSPIFDCELYGEGDVARKFTCSDTGETLLEDAPEFAQELGRKVKALKVGGSVEGEMARIRIWFESSNVKIQVTDDAWDPIFDETRVYVLAKGTSRREAYYANKPECENSGEVLIYFNGCGAPEGDWKPSELQLEVCGPPVVECGAPLASGAQCNHHKACASGDCFYPSGVCR
jgi:hypothetical protein